MLFHTVDSNGKQKVAREIGYEESSRFIRPSFQA